VIAAVTRPLDSLLTERTRRTIDAAAGPNGVRPGGKNRMRKAALFVCLIGAAAASWAQSTGSARATRDAARQSPMQSPSPALQRAPAAAPSPAVRVPARDAAIQPDIGATTPRRPTGDAVVRPGVTEEVRSVDRPAITGGRETAVTAPFGATARPDSDSPAAVRPVDSAAASAANARVAAREQVAVAGRLKSEANRLSEQSFARPADLRMHRDAVATLENAASTLARNAHRLEPADFTAAEYQIDHANRMAARVNSTATAGQVVGTAQAEAVRNASRNVQPIAIRIASGQPPLPVRHVSVRVARKDAADEVRGLQVYVLPGGILDEPALYSPAEIRKYLTHFSFSQLTSPAEEELRVFDTRLWVGPRMKYDEMVNLVSQGKVKNYRVIDNPAIGNTPIELTFVAPDDLVQP
jgi:hypothetical protein